MTTLALPGAAVEWTPGAVRVRRRGPVDPGVESVVVEWRKASDGDLLATVDKPTAWNVTHRIDGVRVSSSASVTLGPADTVARRAYTAGRVELWVWWRGELIHRGPLRQRRWDGETCEHSADDGAVWIDGITCIDNDPDNPYADELDEGRVMSMADAYARRTVPAVGGGELSSGVPLLRPAWVDKPAGGIVDAIALAAGVEWMVVPDLVDGAYRVRWSPLWGRNIGSGEWSLRCMPGERSTVTSWSGGESGTDVAGRVLVRSETGQLVTVETDLWGDGLWLERFVQAPTGMEDPDALEYLGIQETVAGDWSSTWELADRADAMRVRIGDRVVARAETADSAIDGVVRVLTWEIGNPSGDDSGARVTVGLKPALEASTLWQQWQDRLKELEERRGRPTLGALVDVRVEDPDDPEVAADEKRLEDVRRPGARLVNKSRTIGGKTINYWAPGPAEAESPEQWLIGPISLTSGGGDYGEITTGLIPAGMDWDPERPWRGSVSVSVSTTAHDELRDTGWTAIAFRSPVQSPTAGYSGLDLSLAAANSWAVTVPLDGLAGWPALHVDAGAIAYADPDATALVIARIRQI